MHFSNHIGGQEFDIVLISILGECWANSKADTYNKDGPAETDSSCITLGYKPCTESAEYCVGKSEHNFVYRIVGKAVET